MCDQSRLSSKNHVSEPGSLQLNHLSPDRGDLDVVVVRVVLDHCNIRTHDLDHTLHDCDKRH
jgi:hypothetical protein